MFSSFSLRLAAILLVAMTAAGQVIRKNDRLLMENGTPSPFDVTKHAVPPEELVGGGPPKDGIPAIDNPKFVSAKEADRFLRADDRVLALELNGVAKAYPINILNWHEIVNDEFKGRPAAVTW